MTPAAARTVLDAVIREQLREAWERGMDTAPCGVNALADTGAPDAFGAIALAADNYAAAIAAAHAGDGMPAPPTVVEDDDIVLVQCADTMLLPPGSHMRAARCLACAQPIGARPFTVFGIATVAGPPRTGDDIESDVFMVHADHWPMDPDALEATVARGLQSGASHR